MQDKDKADMATKNPKKANLLDHHSIKHLLDESVTEIVKGRGYIEDVRISNIRLFLGTIIIIIALIAQFYYQKFPENRNFLIGCVILQKREKVKRRTRRQFDDFDEDDQARGRFRRGPTPVRRRTILPKNKIEANPHQLPNVCDFFYWIDPETNMGKQMLQAENKNMEREISNLRRDNQVLRKEVEELTRENEKLRKKLQEDEAKVFDYKTKCLIILLVLCIVVWFTKNAETVPNMRNMKYLP